MFGTHMSVILDRPIQLNKQQELKEIAATYVGAGSNRVVFHSPIGTVIKIEATSDHHATSFKQGGEMQMYNPTGVVPIANITPAHTATKIWGRWRTDARDFTACMQVYAPVIAQFPLRHLARSEKSQREKVNVFATFFTTLFVHLVYQAMANLGKKFSQVVEV